MKSYALVALISLCAVLLGLAQESPKVELTARELFYSAAQPPSAPTPKPAPAKKKPAMHAATQEKAAPAPSPVINMRVEPVPRPDGVHIIPAAAVTAPAPKEGSALGMRYTILKLTGGQMVEVAPDAVFHAGDRIQFNVETNGPGYLYIVSQGSSGTWKPMFPSADVDDGNNHIGGFRSYTMPPKSRLVFDEQAGTEKIFIVFSRQPEPNLENTIYSLQAPQAKPASQTIADPKPKQLLVASVDDGMVGQLRNTYSRDLIVETVDESTPGDKKEKARYVVNPTGSQDSRVVADLQLVHQ
jgi:hypothetical protein